MAVLLIIKTSHLGLSFDPLVLRHFVYILILACALHYLDLELLRLNDLQMVIVHYDL